MSRLYWTALMVLGWLSQPLHAQPQPEQELPAPSSPVFTVECESDRCLIHSDELSFEIVRQEKGFVMKPRTFMARPTGPLADFGIIETSQFRVVPDYLYPRDGHYLVGPGETVIEWLRERDTVSYITLDEFLVQALRSNFLHISVMQAVSRDAISGDSRQIRTAPVLEAINSARARLDGNS